MYESKLFTLRRLLSPIYYVHVQDVLALRLRVHFRTTSPHIAMSHVVMHAAQPDSECDNIKSNEWDRSHPIYTTPTW